MKREELYRAIELPKEITERLDVIEKELDLDALEPFLQKMMIPSTAEEGYLTLKAHLNEDSDQLRMLFCQLECACRQHEAYEQKEISDKIFTATMKCFTRFIRECERRHGHMYFDRGWWTYRQISMSLFRIGDLEYEMNTCSIGGPDKEPVICIHIPSDAVFSEVSVDMSLQLADIFFAKKYPDHASVPYICESWLLSPVLKDLLDEDSRILSFMERFRIYRTEERNMDFLEWLFRVPEDFPAKDLPEETSLQKKAKKRLLEGTPLGAAYGLLLS